MHISDFFPDSYLESRVAFLRANESLAQDVESFILPGKTGADGEALAIDIARVGDPDSQNILVVTAGTHGVEGFCGAGCIQYLLNDDQLKSLAIKHGVGIVVIHGVNPYGFSHLRRVNEDNVDLNRNWLDFSKGVPENRDYESIDQHLIPDSWPPSEVTERELVQIIDLMGQEQFRRAIARGQYTYEDGLYFGGKEKCWSLKILFSALKAMLKDAGNVGWIDIHTGLGPYGHGEKMYVGRPDADEEARAKRWWGQDVSSVNQGDAVSGAVSGSVVQMIYDLGIPFHSTSMALEFGTIGSPQVRLALRGDHWLHRNGNSTAAQAYAIKSAIKKAFYCDDPLWKGMVLAQFRSVMIQSIKGISSEKSGRL